MKNILLIILISFLISCAQKSKEVVSKIESKELDDQMIDRRIPLIGL